MLRLLSPNFFLDSIYELNLEKLHNDGVKGLIFDLDNTILAWNSTLVPQDVIGYFKTLHGSGFKICIVSNNTKTRVLDMAKVLGIPAISKAIKPRRKAFRRAMNIMGTNSASTAVIGDQIFTDILGGNRLGLQTILISPITRKEFIGTQLVRRVERVILKRLKRKGLL